MASIQRKGRNWYCQFCYFGDRHTFTIGRVSEDEAHAKSAQVDYLLVRLRQRLIELPPGVDIVAFVQYDGKLPASSIAPVDAPSRQRLTPAAPLYETVTWRRTSMPRKPTCSTPRGHIFGTWSAR